MPVRNEVESWLHEAKADLRHAKKSLEMGDYNWACFAAQQAAEKALKAYLLHVAGEYARGHDLVALYKRAVREGGLVLNEAALSRLSVYYTIARYPNAGIERPSEEIAEGQAVEAVATSEVVIDEVSKAVGDP